MTRFRYGAAPLLLLASTAFAADTQTGTFKAGERYTPPETDAPVQASQMYVKTIDASSKTSVALPVTGEGKLIIWSVPISASQAKTGRTPLKSTLRTPEGRTLRATEQTSGDMQRVAFNGDELGIDVKGMQEAIHVEKAGAGLHQLDLDSQGVRTAVNVVVGEPESKLVLLTSAGPLSRQPGQPVTLRARIADGDAAVSDAQVFARVAPPNAKGGAPIAMFDDGQHDDGVAGDGVYGAIVSDLGNDAGFWSVRFDAEGRTNDGTAFARTGSSGFKSEPGAARLAGAARAERVGNVLRVQVTVSVETAGFYKLEGTLAGAANEDGSRPALSWAEASQRLDAGQATLTLDLPLVGKASAGPVMVDLALLGYDPMGVAFRTTIEVN